MLDLFRPSEGVDTVARKKTPPKPARSPKGSPKASKATAKSKASPAKASKAASSAAAGRAKEAAKKTKAARSASPAAKKVAAKGVTKVAAKAPAKPASKPTAKSSVKSSAKSSAKSSPKAALPAKVTKAPKAASAKAASSAKAAPAKGGSKAAAKKSGKAAAPAAGKASPTPAGKGKATPVKAVPAKAAGGKAAGGKASGGKSAGGKSAGGKSLPKDSTAAANPRSVIAAAISKADDSGYVFINGRRVRMISTKGLSIPKRPKAVVVAEPEPEVQAAKIRAIKTKLSAADLRHYRDLLLERRRELVGTLTGMEEQALRSSGGNLSNMPLHMADIGSDTYEQDFTLGMAEAERRLLGEIDAALQRIADRIYGVCQMTGKPIPKARLNAKPWAKYTIEAAKLVESGLAR